MSALSPTQVFLGSLAETVALLLIWRVWSRPPRRSIYARLFWSVILLIPLFGIAMYFFIVENPDEHPYDSDTMRSGAESHYTGSDHH